MYGKVEQRQQGRSGYDDDDSSN